MQTKRLATELGDVIRDVRLTIRWSQRELAARVGISQQWLSELERGIAGGASIDLVDDVLSQLGVSLKLEGSARQVAERRAQHDPAHALAVSYVARHLERAGWLVATEVEIGRGRSRGWIDLLAYHPVTRRCLVVEVKTELRDFGGLERQLGWYEREATWAARRLGWHPEGVSSAVLMLATAANDESVETFRSSFDRWPVRGVRELTEAIAGRLRVPRGERYLAMIDPLSRAQEWVVKSRRDGRRSNPVYQNYADFMARHRRFGRPAMRRAG